MFNLTESQKGQSIASPSQLPIRVSRGMELVRYGDAGWLDNFYLHSFILSLAPGLFGLEMWP